VSTVSKKCRRYARTNDLFADQKPPLDPRDDAELFSFSHGAHPSVANSSQARAMPPATVVNAIPAVWLTMAKIFATMFSVLGALALNLTPARGSRAGSSRGSASRAGSTRAGSEASSGGWLCDPKTNPSKHHAEVFILKVSAGWIASVGVVIALGTYEWWGKWGYAVYCVACASPLVLVPLFKPLRGDVRDAATTTRETMPYIFKANLWIAVFSFIGNYWYTHYFYVVLQAKYTFEAHRLNDVPIALYFMTHAYFMFYHVVSNCILRKARRAYKKNNARFVFECALICAAAYTTAFMESLTICGFPYYDFKDRDMAYTLGSAFYGIYFLVSFPMFLEIDENPKKKMTMKTVFWESMGSAMAVLCLLDFVRLSLGMDFVMKKA